MLCFGVTLLINHLSFVSHIRARPREYIDVPLPKSVINSNLDLLDHESSCRRYNQLHSPMM